MFWCGRRVGETRGDTRRLPKDTGHVRKIAEVTNIQSERLVLAHEPMARTTTEIPPMSPRDTLPRPLPHSESVLDDSIAGELQPEETKPGRFVPLPFDYPDEELEEMIAEDTAVRAREMMGTPISGLDPVLPSMRQTFPTGQVNVVAHIKPGSEERAMRMARAIVVAAVIIPLLLIGAALSLRAAPAQVDATTLYPAAEAPIDVLPAVENPVGFVPTP